MVTVFLLLITIITSCKHALSTGRSDCNRIKDYLELELKFSADTIRYGEHLVVVALYKNKTDTSLAFYPKTVVALVTPLVGFECQSYFLNDTIDVTCPAEVKPQSTYLHTYKIKVEEPFFVKGDNLLRLVYRFKEMKGKDKIYNKLCGLLESQEVKLIVVP
ncbi:MAG: hypothetical protein IJJ78_05980 [Paludibacteraceae bacterium]|nr:hypothetical protein [Paludibacteraceae bacterium]